MALDNVFTPEMAILGHFKLSPFFFANIYFLSPDLKNVAICENGNR